MIILRVKYVWSCYSALQLKRAIVANLKKKKKKNRDGETVGS